MKTPVLMKVPWRSWAQGRSWRRLSGTHSSTTSLQHLGVEGPAGFAFRRSVDPVCCSLQKCTGVPQRWLLLFSIYTTAKTLCCAGPPCRALYSLHSAGQGTTSPPPTPPAPAHRLAEPLSEASSTLPPPACASPSIRPHCSPHSAQLPLKQ